jgi:hypothetical protein
LYPHCDGGCTGDGKQFDSVVVLVEVVVLDEVVGVGE